MDKKSPKISIIIPATRETNDLSVLVQHLQSASIINNAHEIIIVRSKSVTYAELVDSKKHVVTVYSKHQRSSAMNAGARMASGDILYFLHSDSYPPDGFDKLIVDACRDGAGAGSFRLRFDTHNLMLKSFAWFTRFPWYWLRFGDQSLFVSATNFNSISGFDETLSTMEDMDIVKRLKNQTSFKVIDKQVVTSARKYETYGFFRVQFFYIIVVVLYHLGFSQQILLKILRKMTHKY